MNTSSIVVLFHIGLRLSSLHHSIDYILLYFATHAELQFSKIYNLIRKFMFRIFMIRYRICEFFNDSLSQNLQIKFEAYLS